MFEDKTTELSCVRVLFVRTDGQVMAMEVMPFPEAENTSLRVVVMRRTRELGDPGDAPAGCTGGVRIIVDGYMVPVESNNGPDK